MTIVGAAENRGTSVEATYKALDKQIGALQLSTNWSASKLRLQHIIRPSLGHRPLFISTLFGNVLWTDLDRRREILDVCEVHGFTPEYVDEPLSNTAITDDVIKRIRSCQYMVVLLPLESDEDLESVKLRWPAAEYFMARALDKPVV